MVMSSLCYDDFGADFPLLVASGLLLRALLPAFALQCDHDDAIAMHGIRGG
jgi:hypothetical protein